MTKHLDRVLMAWDHPPTDHEMMPYLDEELKMQMATAKLLGGLRYNMLPFKVAHVHLRMSSKLPEDATTYSRIINSGGDRTFFLEKEYCFYYLSVRVRP